MLCFAGRSLLPVVAGDEILIGSSRMGLGIARHQVRGQLVLGVDELRRQSRVQEAGLYSAVSS